MRYIYDAVTNIFMTRTLYSYCLLFLVVPTVSTGWKQIIMKGFFSVSFTSHIGSLLSVEVKDSSTGVGGREGGRVGEIFFNIVVYFIVLNILYICYATSPCTSSLTYFKLIATANLLN